MGTENDKPAITEGTTAKPLRAIKDSVFRDLFETPQYLLELYKALHPEDETATEADLGNVTIKHVMFGKPYNDLGFTVRDRLLVMVEAQSTWSVNIVVRVLLYLAETWNEHINATNQSSYSSTKLKLPEPEFYVIYTGKRAGHPEYLALSEEFLPSKLGNLELKVKVLYGDDTDDIIGQYVMFTKVVDEQIKEKGQTEEAVLEAIRICKDRNVLRSYLESREKEVVGIMLGLFDQERQTEIYAQQQTRETQKKNAIRLYAKGFKEDEIAEMLNESIEDVTVWIAGDVISV